MADVQTIRTAFEHNEAALKQRPSAGRKTGKVKVCSQDGLACEIESGPWTFSADMPKQVGGGETAPTSGIYEAGALGSCLTIMARMWAAKLDMPTHWSAIRYRVTVESDAPEADVRRVPP